MARCPRQAVPDTLPQKQFRIAPNPPALPGPIRSSTANGLAAREALCWPLGRVAERKAVCQLIQSERRSVLDFLAPLYEEPFS